MNHTVKTFEGLSLDELQHILHKISRLKVGVIGDGCLDIYWHADMTRSEISRETPHYPLPVTDEIHSLGAAANVAHNLKVLGCQEVHMCTVIGQDWRGPLLLQTLLRAGINTAHVLEESSEWRTPAYCKPIRHGLQDARQEDARIDFHNDAPLRPETVEQVIAALDQMVQDVDIVVASDQFAAGVIQPHVRERLTYWSGKGKTIVVDSRERIGDFKGVIVKPNEVEVSEWYFGSKETEGGWDDWVEAGVQLSCHAGAPCCLTLGEKGSLWIEGESYMFVPTSVVSPPLDIVGAGDCFLSALSSALAAGFDGVVATAFANLAASVVVKKIGMTGTASPDELLRRYEETNS